MALTPTDQTVQVAKGTKLDVNNFAGDVNVKVWDKDAVRVEVNHSDRETVDIKQGEQSLTRSLAIGARRAAPLARLHDQRAVVDGDHRRRHLRRRHAWKASAATSASRRRTATSRCAAAPASSR